MKFKDYDDKLLVELIARGEHTHAQIAKKVGLNKKTVWRIANGISRRELQPRIEAVVNGIVLEAQRKGARWFKKLIEKHISEGMEGSGETARKCREYAINKILDHIDPELLKASAEDNLPAPGLTREDYENLAKLKDGPQNTNE